MNSILLTEYDPTFNAKLDPYTDTFDFTVPSDCIITFFDDIVTEFEEQGFLKVIGTDKWENGILKYYIAKKGKREIGVVRSWAGAPIAAAILDTLIAMGAKRVIACGGCGIMLDDIKPNAFVLAVSGLRDEGTSFHYQPSGSIIESSHSLNMRIIDFFEERKLEILPYKTWTTDGLFRETDYKINKRKDEGCAIVDMEFSALCAVAKFRGIEFSEIFYCGDNISKMQYEANNWHNQTDTRKQLLGICLEVLADQIQ